MAWRGRRKDYVPREPTEQEAAIAASISRRRVTSAQPKEPSLSPRTVAHLREAGLHNPADDEHPDPTTFCICNKAYATFDDEEGLISCDNRQCAIVKYHLKCVGLPSQPPSLYGWMCPACRDLFSGAEARERKGLFDHKDRNRGPDAQTWLAQAEYDKKMKKAKKKKMKKDGKGKEAKSDAAGSEGMPGAGMDVAGSAIKQPDAEQILNGEDIEEEILITEEVYETMKAELKEEQERVARREAEQKRAERGTVEQDEAEKKKAARKNVKQRDIERKEATRIEAEQAKTERNEAKKQKLEKKTAQGKNIEQKKLEQKRLKRRNSELDSIEPESKIEAKAESKGLAVTNAQQEKQPVAKRGSKVRWKQVMTTETMSEKSAPIAKQTKATTLGEVEKEPGDRNPPVSAKRRQKRDSKQLGLKTKEEEHQEEMVAKKKRKRGEGDVVAADGGDEGADEELDSVLSDSLELNDIADLDKNDGMRNPDHQDGETGGEVQTRDGPQEEGQAVEEEEAEGASSADSDTIKVAWHGKGPRPRRERGRKKRARKE